MSDQPADPNEEIKLPKDAQERIDEEKEYAILTEQIKHDLETNPKYKKIFEGYEQSDVEHFINEYSHDKARYLRFGEMEVEFEERDLLRFETAGAEKLKDILRKKLFDLESQWRAELITIPGVEQSWDFRYWEEHINRCPFIPPISEAEVDAYVNYVLSDSFDDEEEILSWDDLRYIVKEDEEGDLCYPEWYSFYDMRFGTGSLFKLPDIRGEKEEFYRHLYFEERDNGKPGPDFSMRSYYERPHIGFHDLEFMEKFIKEFEDEKLLKYFRASEAYNARHNDEELDEAIKILKVGGKDIPIEADEHWRDGIMKAAGHFRQEKLAEGVRTAYGDYLMRLENNMIVPEEDEDDHMDSNRKCVKEQILRGRVLNGEPPDLNF
jgi:hypothetical protein